MVMVVIGSALNFETRQKPAAPETEPPKNPKGAPTQPNTGQRHRRSGPKTTTTSTPRDAEMAAGAVDQDIDGS